jgi:NTE family protein
VVEWLSEHLRATTFGELRDDDDDPGSATSQPGRNVRLVVLASDVSNHRLAYLPWDFTTVYPRQGAPDGGLDARPIVDAVRASMSIPFFYQPAKIDYDRTVDGDTTHEIAWMVDGGMLSNFPVQVFDRTDDKPPRWPTFGIKLSARPETAQAPHPMGGTLDFARSLIATMTGFFDRVHIEDPKVIERTIFVDTTGVSSTDFGIDRATQDRLFDNGRTAATAFLQGLKS